MPLPSSSSSAPGLFPAPPPDTPKSLTLPDSNYEPSAAALALAPLSRGVGFPASLVPVPRYHLLGGLLAWSVLKVPGPLEPSGVRGGEDRGLSHVFHEPPLSAERRTQQHRYAGAETGGDSAPSAYHGQVSYTPLLLTHSHPLESFFLADTPCVAQTGPLLISFYPFLSLALLNI